MRAPRYLCAALVSVAVGFIAPVGPAHSAASTSTSCLPGSLKSALSRIERQFGPVTVISTHRPGAKVASSGRPSRHANCEAVDFNPAPGTYKAVAAWLKENHQGGVGTYSCGMHHIHIDAGPTYRWHTCSSN